VEEGVIIFMINNIVNVEVKIGAVYLPEYKTEYSAAADIYSLDTKVIRSKSTEIFSTGLFMRPARNFCLRVLSRSGLAFKYGVFVLNSDGLIDEDYSDEIKVILANFGDEDYEVKEGDRIAQLKVEPYYTMQPFLVENLRPVKSSRVGGLGSTGR